MDDTKMNDTKMDDTKMDDMNDTKWDIFNLNSEEFKFLNFPNTFLSGEDVNDEFNRSANTQIEENFKELLKVTNGGLSEPKQHGQMIRRTNYLDDLNDLKELKRMEDEKLRQQSLDRLSKLSVTNFTSKFENKSNEHLPTVQENEPSKFNTTFDFNQNEVNKTFVLNIKHLNLSGRLDVNDTDDVNNTFTLAKNYDEVQKIARQEERLKRRNTTFNNATITKTKRTVSYTSKLNENVKTSNLGKLIG
jgi:hypothetical protein